jgi:hypothetical protein
MAESTSLRELLEELHDKAGSDETYDLALARSLDAGEGAAYAQALDAAIKSGDDRAALTAGSLGYASAIPTLKSLAGDPGSFGLAVRRALTTLGEGAFVVDGLVKDLQAPGKIHRFAAAMALAKAGRPKNPVATEGLIEALNDADDLVRTRAFESLLAVLDVEKYAQNAAGDDVELRSPLRRLDLLLGSALQSLREPARRELEQIARGLLAGDTPEQVGIVYTSTTAPDFRIRLGRSLFVNTDMPLDEALAAGPADRKWAEALIAKALERGVVRAPGALATLGATWTVPALQEAAALPDADEAFRQEAEKAISQLTGPPN